MSDKKRFALIGASGYIAPRHMQAITETGNELVAALDPYDGIGIMDSHFPQASFFTEFERFDRFIDKYHRENDKKIDYIAITTPNYLHDAHIRFTLKSGCDAICEKPLVLNPHNIDQLKIIEQETGKRVNNILQLRLHPSIIALKEKVQKELEVNPNKIYDIDLTYLTSRGKWYFVSWKGDEDKSGGIASNIGVHFYDMLAWIFGEVKENIVHLKQPDANAGLLRLKNANVRWFLSVNYDYIPEEVKAQGQTTFRSITVEGEEIEFSGGFKDLHTRSYEEILAGNGFGLDEAYGSIDIVSQIRKMTPIGLKEDYHPFCKKII
ncbi:Gfo/Idh/MocA family protein [Halarcobacter bivalviorum]|uniref:Oxidoreductase n=1 Tax=Halarcobacter bivalviorum TaxID=663364 RepID=A0AAX2ABZ6_9BACT|nr:Gfo/Idh/MocA family oxidoreductase [Halarcobacter bivalviorum]AXH11873.1 oxidoreductase, Gfo/Idh/MocA family [Halarcobacter bivalviorum]RXK10996.1 oxidoreductase [Halarcobacter bivalviorum]